MRYINLHFTLLTLLYFIKIGALLTKLLKKE